MAAYGEKLMAIDRGKGEQRRARREVSFIDDVARLLHVEAGPW